MTTATIDITSHIIGGGRKRRLEIVDWLSENCGEYYGRGHGDVIHVGRGWEIRVEHSLVEYEDDTYSESHWVVDITDDAVRLWFIMVWA